MLHLLSRKISDVNKGVIKWSKDMSYSKNIFTFTGLKISESLIVWDHTTVVYCNDEMILLPTYMNNKTTHSHKRELELDWAWTVKKMLYPKHVCRTRVVLEQTFASYFENYWIQWHCHSKRIIDIILAAYEGSFLQYLNNVTSLFKDWLEFDWGIIKWGNH